MDGATWCAILVLLPRLPRATATLVQRGEHRKLRRDAEERREERVDTMESTRSERAHARTSRWRRACPPALAAAASPSLRILDFPRWKSTPSTLWVGSGNGGSGRPRFAATRMKRSRSCADPYCAAFAARMRNW